MNQDLENVNREIHGLRHFRDKYGKKMRVRNRKGATELLEANPQYVVLNPLEAKGKWRTCLEMTIPFMWKLEVERCLCFRYGQTKS